MEDSILDDMEHKNRVSVIHRRSRAIEDAQAASARWLVNGMLGCLDYYDEGYHFKLDAACRVFGLSRDDAIKTLYLLYNNLNSLKCEEENLKKEASKKEASKNHLRKNGDEVSD